MPTINTSNANTDFTFISVSQDRIEFVSQVTATANTYAWLTPDGHLVTAIGTFTYDGTGNLVTGAVNTVTINLMNDGTDDVVISGIPGADILQLLLSHNSFWIEILQGVDTFAGTLDVVGQFFGDGYIPGFNAMGAADTFNVSISGPGRVVWMGDYFQTSTSGIAAGGDDVITVSGSTTDFDRSVIYGDMFANGFSSTFASGNDSIDATAYTSSINAFGDVDINLGNLTAGNDTILTGSSNDTIAGDVRNNNANSTVTAGMDIINSGAGVDTIYGDVRLNNHSVTSATDTINAGSGNDRVYGDVQQIGSGTISTSVFTGANDTIFGEGDDDELWGDIEEIILGAGIQAANVIFGTDTIYGGAGNDTIWGDFEIDHAGILSSDAGAVDFLFGDAGEDTIHGNGGADWIYGGDHNDTLNGGAGSDLMWGDDGEDTMNGGADGDFMWGGADGDTMHGNDGIDWLRGEGGVDMLFGDAGDDILIGGIGDDIMEGGIGTDTFYGEADNDTINGGANGDVAFGQEGNDIINGGSEGDFLFGGAGEDTINGGTENDLMWGDMPGMGDGVEDIFVFEDNWGFDAIYDFELGIDQISMGAVTGLTQFSDLTVFDGGANVTVVFGSSAITLYGVTLAELNANQADFDFSVV